MHDPMDKHACPLHAWPFLPTLLLGVFTAPRGRRRACYKSRPALRTQVFSPTQALKVNFAHRSFALLVVYYCLSVTIIRIIICYVRLLVRF